MRHAHSLLTSSGCLAASNKEINWAGQHWTLALDENVENEEDTHTAPIECPTRMTGLDMPSADSS